MNDSITDTIAHTIRRVTLAPLLAAVMLILVCWASIATKRHTLAQLGGGLLIPMALTARITALEYSLQNKKNIIHQLG